jgi:non-specific protein-tyrosine kinase
LETNSLDLREYLRVIARRWRVIISLALLGTVLGAGATYASTPQYQATATLFVSLQGGADTAELNQGNTFAQARVQSYTAVATSPQVTGPVVQSLGLHMTRAQLAGRITADAPLDTVLLHITVTDTQQRRTARIANAVADRFAVVVSDLERPPGGRQSPVHLTVTAPAIPPLVPSSPHATVDLGLGLAVGLAVGIALAVLLESLDTSLRGPASLAEFLADISGPSLLSSIIFDPKAPRHPLATRDDKHGRRAEGFRRLRTNLHFVHVDRQPRVIAVTSALPSEGKTSVAVNLAGTLAESGASVCLVDADLRRPSAAKALGLVRDAGLTTVLIGMARTEDMLQSAGSFSVLSSGAVPPNPAELLGTEQFRAALRSLAKDFDHVVVDTGPVLPVTDAAVIGPAVDGYLLVVRAGQTSRSQVADAIRTLERVGTPLLGTVLNMAPAKGDGSDHGYAYEYQPQSAAVAPLARLWSRRRSHHGPVPAKRLSPAPTRPTRLAAAPAAVCPVTSDGERQQGATEGSSAR